MTLARIGRVTGFAGSISLAKPPQNWNAIQAVERTSHSRNNPRQTCIFKQFVVFVKGMGGRSPRL
jgi:hypothetical protein